MKLYIAYSTDKYELPVYVERSTTHLANMLGLKPQYVAQSISRMLKGEKYALKTGVGRVYVTRIEVDD